MTDDRPADAPVSDLRSEVLVPPGEKPLSDAIAETLRTPVDQRVALFTLRVRAIEEWVAAHHPGHPWTCTIYRGTDGSHVFRGGVGHSLVIDGEGRLWRALSYEDFETTFDLTPTTCTIATLTPLYRQMRQYLPREEAAAGGGKRVLVLVGPKGAGKSTIGDLLSRERAVHFLRVEPIFLELRTRLGASHPGLERLGFAAVLEAVSDALSRHDRVCIETTGASCHVPWLLQELGRRATVVPVRVLADPEQCLERIHRRDPSVHIPVSDGDVDRINAIAHGVELPWAGEIDNRGPLDAAAVVGAMRRLLD